MNPLRLYIENFQCHSNSFIDFSLFKSALIVGKIENNDLYSNGVGKTSIFKAIEYALFNQADVNLEKIIRDDSLSCRVVFDFTIEQQEYRLVRVRTKKSSDLSLYQKKDNANNNVDIYHTIINGIYEPLFDEKNWKDISGRPASATEKELSKLIKINLKAFRSTVHFLQNDFTGLSTATPEKRKGIFKEGLGLLIYSKLEKLAKEKSNTIIKEIDKHKTLIDSLGDPVKSIIDIQNQISVIEQNIIVQENKLCGLNSQKTEQTLKINELKNNYSLLESKFSSLIEREKSLKIEKSRLDTSIKEYQTKKSNVVKAANILSNEIKTLREDQVKLASLDYSQIDILLEQISSLKDNVAQHNVIIQNNMVKYEELKIPVPNENICKHCRQELTAEHKNICKAQIDYELDICQKLIKSSKKEIVNLNEQIIKHQQSINSLNLSKQQLSNINTQITTKNKEIQDKRTIFNEYSCLLEKFISELVEKEQEIIVVQEELKISSIEEANLLKEQIVKVQSIIDNVSAQILVLNKEIAHLNNSLAVLRHSIEQKRKDQERQDVLKNELLSLEDKFQIYPLVLQAFSSTGIPNLIIQNVLDDLQIEANNLLLQLKPGLQLSFAVEKIKGDGTQDDTLDINYTVNGKERDYEQLSGAMKLAVVFSLKLGFSFLLQKMIGVDVKFLLIDEIDQSLDKAGVDAFADIVKFFQKDFTILIITHNDRLKDKFSHAILVEQDINMISHAQVVSSW